MRTLEFPGGWYADCLTTGQYVVGIFGSHLETSWGRINFLPGATPIVHEPLWLRLNEDVSAPAFAGQSHGYPFPHPDNDLALEFFPITGLWAKSPKKAVGTNPVIYDASGQIQISDGSLPMGSGGWRYVSGGGIFPVGRLVTGDETVAPTGRVRNLWEWTDLTRGDELLVVGQGPNNDGVHVQDGNVNRVLEGGVFCRRIVAHRVNDDVAIAYYHELGGSSYLAKLTWATVAELRALPLVPVVVPPVPDLPIGPVGDGSPLPVGSWVDLAAGFRYTAALWPRGNVSLGDRHPMDMQVLPDGRIAFVKFGDTGQGRSYELFSIDDDPNGYVQWLEDASDLVGNAASGFRPLTAIWPEDTRAWPKRMRVGRQFGFTSSDHHVEYRLKSDGTLIDRVPYRDEVWVETVWQNYYCGKDQGEQIVARVVVDNTAGAHEPGRNVETYLVALGPSAPAGAPVSGEA